ncbi:protein Skeletor, isoforms B/C-like [Argiope bruennichi]|uniref:protein Skeletor, isoforms B/C-like n=1 Tax=Argiope bruennichi TaxID=94029 RepID=UPI0024942AB6|nr:protein Skeletor, isoforms B/C-like [Argiope bruennichi]
MIRQEKGPTLRMSHRILLALLGVVFTSGTVAAQTKYYGKLIGNFKTYVHGVQGTVYIANENTIFIKDFEYDGQGPDAFFWGDTLEEPTTGGFIIPIENGTTEEVLKQYDGQDLILTLPDGKLVKDIKSLSVWCRQYSVNFGSIVIPSDDLPYQKSLGPLPTLAHGVRSEDVIILDSKTIFIVNLYYDGAGPDAFFLVGKGVKPHSKGQKVPDENGSLEKLHGYNGENVTLELPGDLTVFDADWFALYCIQFEQNFGHVYFPEQANIPANIEDLRMTINMPSEVTTTQGRAADGPISAQYTDGSYYGKPIADFKTNAHDVKGTVFAASENTFFILDFSYDGEGPDAYFWAGTTEKPSPEGFIVPDEFGTKQVLGKYSNQNIAITLPDGKKISDIKWLSVWCRKFAVNFGHIMIPEDFEAPREADLGSLSSLAHGVKSGSVIVKDIKTIAIKNLYYDGAGPDAFFLVGTGSEPHPEGTKVPDENGSLEKLHGYQGQDIELRLPGELTVFDIEWLAMYCIAFKQNFGDVRIPKYLNVPADLTALKAEVTKEIKFDNCEELFPGILHVSWKILGQDLILQLAGRADDNEYISFGRSGSDNRAVMIGGDVAVAYYDADAKEARVVDYYLSAKSQCSQGSGACPDIKMRGEENTALLNWEKSDGIMKVTFKRPLGSSDGQDLSIPVSIPVSVIAAIGPLNSQKEVAFHTHYYTKDAKKIHFGRSPPQDRCNPFMSATTMKPKSWPPTQIVDATTFRAQIGPTGGDKGYTAITGSQSWGIAWWINGQLIPELTVRRGVNYTFIVEGGNNPSNPASYHPLYITNNPEGGGGQFLDQLGLPNHTVYAGIETDSNQRMIPTGVGRLCEWKHKTIDKSAEVETFEEYKKTLMLDCMDGSPGTFYWVPDEATPDLVYYQCFTHRNLGWKIHVVDSDAKVAGAMEHLSNNEPNSAAATTLSYVLLFLVTCIAIF